MKAVRVILLGAGILALLVVIVAGVALNSSFQTWAARRALAEQSGVSGTVGEVSAGLRRTELSDVTLNYRGALLTLPAAAVEVPLLSAGLRERVLVKSLVAKGWTLDLSNVPNLAVLLPAPPSHQVRSQRGGFSLLSSAYAAEQASAASTAAVFQGVLTELRLPVDLSLDGVNLEGEVILPMRGEPTPIRVRVDLKGGGLAAGRDGAFTLALAAAMPDGGALTVRSHLTATMDTPRSFTHVGATAAASASGTQIPNGVHLDVAADVARTAVGEDYTLLLSSGGKTLVDLAATLADATSHITGTWTLDLRGTDLSPFALGRRLPVFAAVGEGRFETDTTFGELHADGTLNASANELDAIRPELAAVGEVNVAADFDVLQHGESLRVERFDVTIAGTAPVAKVRALQSFEFNLTTAEMSVADPTKDLIGITLTNLPLGWTQPFLGELEVSGGDVSGEFVASARDGGLGLRAKTPLTMGALSIAEAGEPLVRNLDVALTVSADYTPQGWQAQVADGLVRSDGATLLSLAAKAGQLAGEAQPVKITGRWSADLAGWLSQPVLAGQLQLAGGRAAGEFSASVDGTKALEANVGVSDLVATTAEKLPDIALDVRADIAPDGATTFNAPLVFTRDGRKSDLVFAGTLTSRDEVTEIDAQVTSDLIVAEDVQLLALLVPAGEAAAASDDDEGPFWEKVSGKVTLALKKISYTDAFEVTDVGGTLRVDPGALTLDAVRAVFGPDSDLKLNGGLRYEPAAEEPYALAADLALTNFDTGPAFRAIDAAKLPTVEARVNLTSRISGRGADLADVAEQARGELQLTGKSGVFRALSADLSDKVQRTQSTVAAIGGIIGAVTGKQEYADYANKTQILTDIAKALSEIPFDQLNVTATRGENLNLELKDFTLISPEVRLTGGGAVAHVDGMPLLAQPLNLQLNLGVRGQLADLLKRAGLLEAKEDNLGYTAFVTPITIAGSLASTDTSELRNALLNSALEKSGLLDSLLRK